MDELIHSPRRNGNEIKIDGKGLPIKGVIVHFIIMLINE